ncbi:hypothetical protein AA3271_1867 [Gluconobacter japonicus NBRC 3271]|nr:hypothetical protein AA3271_1867 [Gluconobacter japonicus NBRC 3271]
MIQDFQKWLYTLPVQADDRDNGQPQIALKPRNIDGHAIAFGLVHHTEGDNDRHAKLTEFQQEAEMQAEICCGHHADQELRARLRTMSPKADIACDIFVWAG